MRTPTKPHQITNNYLEANHFQIQSKNQTLLGIIKKAFRSVILSVTDRTAGVHASWWQSSPICLQFSGIV